MGQVSGFRAKQVKPWRDNRVQGDRDFGEAMCVTDDHVCDLMYFLEISSFIKSDLPGANEN